MSRNQLLPVSEAPRIRVATASGAGVAARRAFILLLLPVLVTACEVTPKMNTQEPTPSRDIMQGLTQSFDLEMVAAFIGQPFPDSATDIHALGEAALDTVVMARFDLPRQDLSAYLADVGLTQPLKPGYMPFNSVRPPLKEAETWWSPPSADAAAGAFSGSYQRVGAKNYNVVVVGPDEATVTIYLVVWNT